ncbi:TLD-domain-containing protein [Gigaspora rosea]|uniref:TLD-domain-containing protein n=1 Tax=Gigaspora rosea TaxID=44941 RepID=A0A397W0F6_9GLOM|nr:TLD-domain-containing protein [Gigaspora rosea]
MIVSCEFLLEELVKYLETYLIEKNAHWLRLNFARIYQTSFQNKQLQELQKWCNDIAAKYPSKVFESEDFITLQENALVSLIGRDDLQLEEVKIWNYIIQWGIAQSPGLSSDPKNWSGENFLALKITLQNCLPLIRYFQLSGDDIIDKVKPYKKVLEKNLWEDLMQRFLTPNRPVSSIILPPRIISSPILPPRTTEPFSTVISETHAAEIASWVDKKTEVYSIVNNPYEFKLLIRGTRDGFTSKSFWKLCDKQTNTIVVMKIKGTDEIFGGYNPIAWDKSKNGKYTNCNNSFIFSLKNVTIQNSILSRVKEPNSALYTSSQCGPNFGNYGDLAMYTDFNQHDECYCYPQSYEKTLRNTKDKFNFSVDEYEVYQI